ncbi:hypothetical protein ElyMa_002997800 [Elysia marginata]|uniref:Uncharacterized protein n=1 Tax=Elysia marginata TaxID=1093978 RepID=A0AAV4IDN3_9GAST|nr:hypothetical protein ElyMa_002997800 [Elysia marginata]
MLLKTKSIDSKVTQALPALRRLKCGYTMSGLSSFPDVNLIRIGNDSFFLLEGLDILATPLMAAKRLAVKPRGLSRQNLSWKNHTGKKSPAKDKDRLLLHWRLF